MSLKSWVIARVRTRRRSLLSRVDLPPRDTAFEPSLAPASGFGSTLARPEEPERGHRGHTGHPGHAGDSALPAAEHLGTYAPLIGAVRAELEHFIVSQLRLHLAIADRDRFVLTAIGVHCVGPAESRERLLRFMREFKPEQVKRYLAREVIAGLPNAAAIDLTQFAGLVDVDEVADDAGDYGDLLAELADPRPAAADGPAYEVSLLGRWSETEAAPAAAPRPATPAGAPITPLAGQRCEFDIEDGDGRRRVVLQTVVPGRRYSVGKGEGCDILVRGSYTSRRHAELWLEQGAWWVADAGSTNGVRVESGAGAAASSAADSEAPLRLGEGARLVLSARSEGPPADYPVLALRPAAGASARATPIGAAAPKTPLTAISVGAGGAFVVQARQAGGTTTLALQAGLLPLAIGRSRNQALVIERRHSAVSGHHLDIVALDSDGVQVLVHGDNGVTVDGTHHGAGARLHWRTGQTLLLGGAAPDETGCALVLQRDA